MLFLVQDPKRTGRVRIRDLLSSQILPELRPGGGRDGERERLVLGELGVSIVMGCL